ncbi:MAG: hypothetical protein ACTSPQ_22715 [Candidatus Helarchaeota archaeon]
MDNFALRVAKINGGGVMLISILRVMITRSFLLKDNFRINTFSVTEYIFDFSERARYLYWLFWSCYNLDIDKNNFFEQKYTNRYIDKTWRMARKTPWPEKIVLY